MTKKQLLTEFALFEDFESNAQAERAYDLLISIISKQLIAGNPVTLGENFGEFKIATQPARTGNVRGKAYSVPARQVVKLRVSAPFKALVAGN